jgi:desulfoferrodoxin (superoxide reductase-like protein)
MVDPQNPTDFELKHTPDLVLGTTDEKGNTSLTVGIGQKGIIHPSTPEHWIDYIKVFVNEQLMVDLQYMNLPIRPYGQFYLQLKKGDIIRVESGCNLHGIYENSITVS